MTRSQTLGSPINSCEELTEIAFGLCGRVDLPARQLYRLVGVGLSNFKNDDEGCANHSRTTNSNNFLCLSS